MDSYNRHTSSVSKNTPAKRRPGACEFCKVRKVKCDGKQRCSKCVENGNQCIYLPRKKRRPGPVRKSTPSSQESEYQYNKRPGSTSEPESPVIGQYFRGSSSFGTPTPPSTPPLFESHSGNLMFSDLTPEMPGEDWYFASQMYPMDARTDHSMPDTSIPYCDRLDFWANTDSEICQPQPEYPLNQLPNCYNNPANVDVSNTSQYYMASPRGYEGLPTEQNDFQQLLSFTPDGYWGTPDEIYMRKCF
ncbi:transcription factor [Diplocarpon mali]|nr:transcription factor [Diplocarpon mali]